MRTTKSTVLNTIIESIDVPGQTIRHKPLMIGHEPYEIESPLRANFPEEKLAEFSTREKVKIRLSSDNFVIDIFR